jgi:hypothetical protein
MANYLRVAASIVMLTFYLRPLALLGGAALAYSLYRHVYGAIEQQRRQQQQQAEQQQPDNPNEQILSVVSGIGTWLLVAYTKCVPVVALGLFLSSIAVLVHASLRRGQTEHRLRGRQIFGLFVGAGAEPPRDAAPARRRRPPPGIPPVVVPGQG